MADADQVKVFAFEGEGGLMGATHETLNSSWGLGLGNIVYYIDWNDFGIDSRPFSSIVKSTPQELFETSGWHVEGTDDNEDWESFTKAYYDLLVGKAKKIFQRWFMLNQEKVEVITFLMKKSRRSA